MQKSCKYLITVHPPLLQKEVCDRIWKNQASTHTIAIKLTILPEMDCWFNTLSLFYWVPWSKVTSLVSVAAFPRPCVILKWCFGPISWSWPSCIDVRWLGKPWRAGQCLGVLWAQARSTRTLIRTSGFQSSSYSILYSYIEPIPTPITTMCNIITLT